MHAGKGKERKICEGGRHARTMQTRRGNLAERLAKSLWDRTTSSPSRYFYFLVSLLYTRWRGSSLLGQGEGTENCVPPCRCHVRGMPFDVNCRDNANRPVWTAKRPSLEDSQSLCCFFLTLSASLFSLTFVLTYARATILQSRLTHDRLRANAVSDKIAILINVPRTNCAVSFMPVGLQLKNLKNAVPHTFSMNHTLAIILREPASGSRPG